MNRHNTPWYILPLVLITSLLLLDGWLGHVAQAMEVEINITIRDSQYLTTTWAPPPEGASVVLTITNEDNERHGFTSKLFHNLLIRSVSEGVHFYGKGIEGLYLDPGKRVQLRFQLDRPGDYEFKCDLHPFMRGELLLFHVDVV